MMRYFNRSIRFLICTLLLLLLLLHITIIIITDDLVYNIFQPVQVISRFILWRNNSYHVSTILTYSMEKSTSWEANWFSASQEIRRILWNPKVHYRIHKWPPPVSILSQLDPVHTHTSHFMKIHLTIILPSSPGSPKWSLSFRFPHQNPAYALFYPVRSTCPAHLILLDFITRTTLGEEYRSLSSSLCSFLHSPVTLSLLILNTPSLPCGSHFHATSSSSLLYFNNIRLGVKIMKTLITKFLQLFHESILLLTKHPMFYHPRSILFPRYDRNTCLSQENRNSIHDTLKHKTVSWQANGHDFRVSECIKWAGAQAVWRHCTIHLRHSSSQNSATTDVNKCRSVGANLK